LPPEDKGYDYNLRLFEPCWTERSGIDGLLNGPGDLLGNLNRFGDSDNDGPGYLLCEDCYKGILWFLGGGEKEHPGRERRGAKTKEERKDPGGEVERTSGSLYDLVNRLETLPTVYALCIIHPCPGAPCGNIQVIWTLSF